MKYFHEFDPLHPFNHDESLQILNNKIRLSYIPLKDSVSIRGFLQESILGDVKSNSFWCDYRDSDGYRSANGEIIFDRSHDGDVVDVSYLGIGTVLRAEDMNEVADRLDSLSADSYSLHSDIFNHKMLIENNRDSAINSLSHHDSNPSAHQDLRQSLVDLNQNFDYRFDTLNQSYAGMKKSIDSAFDSIHSEILNSKIDTNSIVEESKSYTDSIHSGTIEKFTDMQNQFDGFYNAIDNGDEYLELKINRLGSNIENQFAVERLSAQNQIKALKSELYQRIDTQSTIAADSVRTELIDAINRDDPMVDSILPQLSNLRDEFDLLTSKYYILVTQIDERSEDLSATDSLLADSIDAVKSETSSQFDSITANVADLSKTLYQARNAINNEIDSLRADVNLANMNLTNSRNMFDRKVDEIKDLKDDINEEFENMMDDFELQIDEIREEFGSDMQEIMESVDSTYGSLLTDFTDNFQSLSGLFYQSYSSLQTALVDVENMKTDIGSSIQAAIDQIPEVDLTQLEDSIDNLAVECGSELANLSNSVENSIKTLDNATGSTINNILASISAMDSKISTSVNVLTASINTVDKKPVVLSTTSSTTPGAIWYST